MVVTVRDLEDLSTGRLGRRGTGHSAPSAATTTTTAPASTHSAPRRRGRGLKAVLMTAALIGTGVASWFAHGKYNQISSTKSDDTTKKGRDPAAQVVTNDVPRAAEEVGNDVPRENGTVYYLPPDASLVDTPPADTLPPKTPRVRSPNLWEWFNSAVQDAVETGTGTLDTLTDSASAAGDLVGAVEDVKTRGTEARTRRSNSHSERRIKRARADMAEEQVKNSQQQRQERAVREKDRHKDAEAKRAREAKEQAERARQRSIEAQRRAAQAEANARRRQAEAQARANEAAARRARASNKR